MIKEKLILILAVVISGLAAALKYMSMKVEVKQSQVDKLKQSIDTAVEVNQVNEQIRTTAKEISDVKDSVNAVSDPDVDSVLLDKYTRGRHKN